MAVVCTIPAADGDWLLGCLWGSYAREELYIRLLLFVWKRLSPFQIIETDS